MNVRIIKRQRINKVQFEIGDEPDFPERDALWLIEQRIAESLDAPQPPAHASVPTAMVTRPTFQPASPPRWSCCGQRPK